MTDEFEVVITERTLFNLIRNGLFTEGVYLDTATVSLKVEMLPGEKFVIRFKAKTYGG